MMLLCDRLKLQQIFDIHAIIKEEFKLIVAVETQCIASLRPYAHHIFITKIKTVIRN